MRRTKTALLKSALALLCCCAMLIGSTFAWFTDSVTSGRNIIATGTLDVELYHSNGAVTNEKVTENTKLFLDLEGNPILWEPGVVSYENLRITNEGDLALVYQLAINATNENYIVDGSNQYGLSQVLKVAVVKGGITATDRESVIGSIAASEWKNLASFQREGALVPDGEETWGVAIYWQPTASDNLWNANNGKTLSSGDALSIDLGIHLTATQMMYENDSFGNDYDVNAKDDIFPSFGGGTSSAEVSVDANGLTTADVTIAIGDISAIVPAGVKVQDGVTALTLSIKEMESSRANIVLGENEALRSLDVHIEGVAADNTTPITVVLPEAAPVGLNLGNYKLYHVEGGNTNEMILVAADADFSAHNQFKYDPATGDMVLNMATFSEVAMVADTENAWEGNFDYSWYTGAVALAEGEATAEYTIANADQLAAFGAIVGGMAEDIDRDDFSGKTVKLIADINLGDKDGANADIIFHPIGYYYNGDSSAPYSTVYSFEGTFDGNGHTIGNFYQNTWEIKGDYDGNYYKDAMGLFGYVVNGTIKNLTVDNFSSDGEFTPTGVIAAYASNSTFENIAITNCNPRVYNTGNGGIVGIGGNSDDPDTCKLTFKNITIDNSNKISALWGSWDVACGGLVGMFRGAGYVDMINCHVAAQIDVYNDVCGNYQYYWYRYAGMMIGTNKNMITDKNGYTVPETSKFHAKDCTVHFGKWNDYYYCELVANSLASYTHDHQFSRLEQISSLDEIKSGDTWTKTGNYLLISGDTKTCYHIVNKDGVLTQHNHDDAGTETVGGEIVLKEDKQIVYLPFNQLFTGYGWGVKHIPVYNGEDYAFEGITILDREVANSVEKFEGKVTELANNKEYKFGDIFSFVNKGVELIPGALTVTITNLDESNPVSATIDYDRENWENGTITLTGIGEITITIQDYYFCTPTTITVNVTDRQSEEKFDVVMNNGDFLHRVGNSGTVALDKLFKAKNGVTVGTISVTVEAVNGTSASGTYSNNAIQFSGTGVVKVTIKDDDKYCTSTVLYLEVVDAENVTAATNATSKNIVLLNNAGFSSLEVSGGYTLYGNGFTLTCGSDAVAVDRTYSFLELKGGTLDNVKIVTPNFSHAIMYEKNKTEGGNPNNTDSSGRTRYNNIRSAVLVSATSKIVNSYISGGRAAIYATSGTLTVENSTIYGGAVANIQTEASSHLVLEDVTLIQEPIKANVNHTSKTVMGLSVVTMCDTTGAGSPITLRGYLHQYAWAHKDYRSYVPSDAQSVIDEVLNQTNFVHKITYADGVTRDSVNLGFAYMPDGTVATNCGNMEDDRSQDEKSAMPYDSIKINNVAAIYTYKNTNGTDASVQTKPSYEATTQGTILPEIKYEEVNENRVLTTSYDTTKAQWKTTLKVDVDAGVYTFSFDKLLAQKYGKNLSYTVTTEDRIAVDKNAMITLNSAISNVYKLTITDNQLYDKNGDTTGKSIETTYIFELLATKTSLPAPTWTSTTLNGTPYIVVDSKGGDWNCAVPVLDGLKIKYWSKKQSKEIELDLANVVSAAGLSKGLQNGSNNTITITVADEYTLTITTTGFKTNDNGKPVVVNSKLYFTVSSSSNYVSTNTTSRTPNISYVFTDANNSAPITLSTSFNVVYATYKGTQYKYSDFCNGKLTTASSGCVTPDTLITLADGSQKPINQVTYADQILVWDFVTGKYVAKSSSIVMNHGYDLYDVVTLTFDDGTTVNTINGHGFFDVQENKFVILGKDNVEQYIGHSFVKDADKMTTTKLVSYSIKTEYTESWSVLTSEQYNCVLEGMLTITPAEVEGSAEFLMPYEIGADMKYDEAKMQADIELYGLYTYADFAEYCTYEQFVALGLENFKVSVAKGYITWDEIIFLLNLHMN